jgi:hypothetical protein
MRRLSRGLAVAAASSVVVPSAAASTRPLAQSPAAGVYSDGDPAFTVGFSCESLASGAAILGPDTEIAVGIQGTPQAPPPVGAIFYVRVTGVELSDPCDGGTTVLPEILPPAGVRVVVSATRPALVRYEQYDGGSVDDAATKDRPGLFGGTEFSAISTRAPEGEPFPIATGGGTMELYVPLQASRRVAAADEVRVVSMIGDGSTPSPLEAQVGLFSGAPAAPAVTAPKRVRLRTARRGVPLVVSTVPGARVTATLRASGTRLASASATADVAGSARLAPRIGKTGRRALARARGHATITVTAVLSDGSAVPRTSKALTIR